MTSPTRSVGGQSTLFSVTVPAGPRRRKLSVARDSFASSPGGGCRVRDPEVRELTRIPDPVNEEIESHERKEYAGSKHRRVADTVADPPSKQSREVDGGKCRIHQCDI